MRVVFMGTPAFVTPVLDALFGAADVSVAAVYAPPDRPWGRGRSPEMPPVKTHALELGLDVLQPESLRSAQVRTELQALRPDLIVVAAYGKFLPPRVLATPPHGCLNLHPSLLPWYRGPSPVPSTILGGDRLTGVTLMLLDEGMDTGPIIAQAEYTLSGEETAETLTVALFARGAHLLIENLDPWVSGRLQLCPQDEARVTVTRKLEREDGRADWMLSAIELSTRRRAYTPWPGLYTHWDGKMVKLLDVVALPREITHEAGPGTVCVTGQVDIPLGVVTGDGLLGLKRLQIEGRNAVTGAEFLRGYPGIAGSSLG